MQKRFYKHIDNLLSDEIDIALRSRAETILKELNLNEGDTILDAGCGWGYYLKLISKLPIEKYKLIGVDLDKKSLTSAQKSLKGKAVKLVAADLEKLPFVDNSFDKVILSEVAEHLKNDKKVFKEIHRVLKKDGFILITVPNHNYPFFWDPVNWVLEHTLSTHISHGFWAGIWTNHLRLYYPKELTSKLAKVGFKIEMQKSLTFLCLPFNKNLLYGGKLPPNLSKSFIKQIKSIQKPPYIKMLLFFVDLNAKLNRIIFSKNIGVSVFIKATK